MSDTRRFLLGGDRISTAMAFGIALCLAAITGIGLFAYMSGVLEQQAPRTLTERQIVQLESVVQRKTDTPQVWADYVRALIVDDRLDKAEEALDRAEDISVSGPQITLERARLAVALGKDADAIDIASRAEKEALRFRFEKQKEYEEHAVTVGSEFIMADVIEEAARIQGQLLAKDGQWASAEEAFETAHREYPTGVSTLVMLGRVREELGDTKGAEEAYREALTFVPDDKGALEGLKRLGLQ